MGSIPRWQLLRGSVERSSASASLFYSPLFLPVEVSKESSSSSDDSDEVEEKPSKTPQKSAKDVEMVVSISTIPSRKIRASLNEHFDSCREISRVSVQKDFESRGPKWFVMVVDAEAYTYDDKVIKKAKAIGKPENAEEEATMETTRAIKHHQES
ncbi:DNA-directed RNA polymerase II 36 kDa polypeptide A [Arachis hypogaea]|uniref:DNA-directed RNA polymerase II 36 kDa polypeptide A n=1 Tax=Arachis hypogaea TaxID=3818 RepID=A0A6B9VAN9_ARAHY|nr:DNA-directed RNA polymerase II 36 kDa polypeptide A [Arachis hypogaea]